MKRMIGSTKTAYQRTQTMDDIPEGYECWENERIGSRSWMSVRAGWLSAYRAGMEQQKAIDAELVDGLIRPCGIADAIREQGEG